MCVNPRKKMIVNFDEVREFEIDRIGCKMEKNVSGELYLEDQVREGWPGVIN